MLLYVQHLVSWDHEVCVGETKHEPDAEQKVVAQEFDRRKAPAYSDFRVEVVHFLASTLRLICHAYRVFVECGRRKVRYIKPTATL